MPNDSAERQARNIAEELDRRALLHNSRGERPLNEEELQPTVDAIQTILRADISSQQKKE